MGSNSTYLYRQYNSEGLLLYVGISSDFAKRTIQHERQSKWFGEVCLIRIERYQDRDAALLAETVAIRTEEPKYNAMGTGRGLSPKFNLGTKVLSIPGASSLKERLPDLWKSDFRFGKVCAVINFLIEINATKHPGCYSPLPALDLDAIVGQDSSRIIPRLLRDVGYFECDGIQIPGRKRLGYRIGEPFKWLPIEKIKVEVFCPRTARRTPLTAA